MLRDLPYPGYTWSFTQHAIGLKPEVLYGFMKCAAPFGGHKKNYDEKITALMVAAGVLTANNRNGEEDAWRDYQQLLAELGLIYSTKICKTLTITDLGQRYLAGELGFSELIGIQSLRYQYPNGQKSTIQNRLSRELADNSISFPATLTELQVIKGVLIKPGTLILRVAIELLKSGNNPSLTASECQAFLLPCRQNAEWMMAVSEIISYRKGTSLDLRRVNFHSRRNIQDWFKFLSKSDFFDLDDSGLLVLTSFSMENIDLVESYCIDQEDINSFWIPNAFDIPSRMDWFDWFGHVPYASQRLLRVDAIDDVTYVEENFVAGLDEDAEEDNHDFSKDPRLNLRAVDLNFLGRDNFFHDSKNFDELVESVRMGAQKKHAKTLLHDRIIKKLAEKFINQGATVSADFNSIDLLAKWKGSEAAIFEVKTVTRRSAQTRLRTAIGQIQEYSYRHSQSGGQRHDLVIVLNIDVPNNSWQKKFLTEQLGIGLMCQVESGEYAYAPHGAQTSRYWTS
ncbi:hypothetical protein [Achromobacter sp. UMC46]|uniref:hypothetical protein n=1 Tax=Achromobacter sp. UMC46 TaxID=1862319 RepID=UPI001602B728|nr:hypothetical protein [Achromobacter sp. UMC46]